MSSANNKETHDFQLNSNGTGSLAQSRRPLPPLYRHRRRRSCLFSRRSSVVGVTVFNTTPLSPENQGSHFSRGRSRSLDLSAMIVNRNGLSQQRLPHFRITNANTSHLEKNNLSVGPKIMLNDEPVHLSTSGRQMLKVVHNYVWKVS